MSNPYYGHPGGNPPPFAQYSRPSPAPASPAPPQQQPSQASGGYTPVQFNDPHTGQNPTQFYGQLLDPFGQPSELFCRMVDSYFFWVDQNCPRSKNTGVMEPEKLFWDAVIADETADKQNIQTLYNDIGTLYDSAGIPYSLNVSRAPVLDRRGFLHLAVFEVKANPEESYKDWNKKLNIRKLTDPMNNVPFPTPIPRNVFPVSPDGNAESMLMGWATAALIKAQRQRTEAQTAQILGAFNQFHTPQSAQPYSFVQGLGQAQSFSQTSSFGQGFGQQAGSNSNISYGQSNAEMVALMQQLEEEKKKASMMNAATNIATNVLTNLFDPSGGGGGGLDFSNFGN